MRDLWLLVAAMVTLGLLLTVLPAGAGEDLEGQLMIHVNQARVDADLLPLTWTAELTWAIGGHVEYLAGSGRFAHEGEGGSLPADRAIAAGYGSRYVGEVLARGYQDPDRIVRAWMESEPHRLVLLHPGFEEAGVWTQRDSSGRVYAGMDMGRKVYR